MGNSGVSSRNEIFTIGIQRRGKLSRKNGKHCGTGWKHCVDQVWAGLLTERRWNGVRTSRVTRQDRKRRTDIDLAGAPAREPPTPLPHCPRHVTTSGTMTCSVLGDIVIRDSRPIGWSPIFQLLHLAKAIGATTSRCRRNVIFPRGNLRGRYGK